MRRGTRILAFAVLGALGLGLFGTVVSAQPPPARGSAAAHDLGLFRDNLAPHGEWIETASGWRWAPRVPADWRPYTRGQWLLTDQGWHWDSNEAFGWATFHYGRWINDARRGWLWAPGTEWAPAWVSWRHGNGFAGWAPLSPRTSATSRGELATLAGSTVSHDFVFVHERSFPDRDIQRRLLPRYRNVALLDATIDVTNYRIVDERVVNLGIDVESVERAVGRPVARITNADGGIAFVHTAARGAQDADAAVPSYTNASVLSLNAGGRTMVIRTADGVEQTVQLDDTLAGFGDVKAGDRVILTLRAGPGWARVTSLARGLPPSTPSRPGKAGVSAEPNVDAEARAFARTMFDSRVASLAQQADRVDRVWGEFVSACKVEGLAQNDGARGWFVLWEGTLRSDLSDGFCRDLFNQIVNLGEPVKQGMIAAEDVARRALDPGELRDIRSRHNMIWGGWALPRPAPLEP